MQNVREGSAKQSQTVANISRSAGWTGLFPNKEHRGGHSGSQAAAALRAPRHEALLLRELPGGLRAEGVRGNNAR